MSNNHQEKQLVFSSIKVSGLSKILTCLPTKGFVKQATNGFLYLDIDDDYIHNVFPLLKQIDIQKPDYFSATTDFIGAHISIIYPDELAKIASNFVGGQYSFNVVDLFSADFLNTRYFALKVQAPELLAIRERYGLPPQLQIYDYYVDFHITIAKKSL